jgi:outer membrane receptor protein involved in Fe transport
LKRGTSFLVLGAALAFQGTAAFAQAADAPSAAASDAPEMIVVTGSRIARSGFTAPSPVTVVGEERMQALAITNVADGLNQLPSFRASASPANAQNFGGSIGARVLDLRGLGAPRTLTLVDGRRFMPSTTDGTVDVNLIPSGLVSRTEVVTGGVSAVYGSDAVAGVVNFILDRKMEGLKFEAQGGVSQRGDDANRFFSIAGGQQIGSRIHITGAFEYEKNDGLADCYTARDWCAQERSIVGNTPAGTRGMPSSIITSDVHTSTLFPGGVINSSIGANGKALYANAASDPLHGIKFLPDGTPGQFNYGDFAGPLFMIGGDGHGKNAFLSSMYLKVPVERYSSYVATTIDVTDSIEAFVDLSYGRVKGTVLSSTFRDFNGSLIGLIQQDNPYIPASVKATMVANNIPQFILGRAGFDFGSPKAVSTTKTYRAVAGLQGTLSNNWKWEAYYQYGRTDFRQEITNDPINANLRRAVDAVKLADGSIVCRVNAVTVTDPACSPINLFGENQFTDAARAYVLGNGFQKTRSTQQVAAANISGDLIEMWAGPLSASVGAEWREYRISGDTDPISKQNGFWVLNGQQVGGKQTVKEAYAELNAPLLKDVPFARTLELNGAFRYTDYSSSGSVETWKAGAIYEPIDALRFRITRSRDIRAPNLAELHGQQTSRTLGVTDPATGLQGNPTVRQGSNPNLTVEKADSWTAGVIFKPTGGFLQRARLSVDYFNIKVKDAIGALGAQTLIDRCSKGATEFCSLITRGPNDSILTVTDLLLNANQQRTSGFDIEFDYQQPLGNAGDLSLRMLGTIVNKLVTVDSAGEVDRAGQTGSRAGAVLGVPDYTIDGTLTWSKNDTSVTLHGRYIPSGLYNTAFIGPDDPNYAITLKNSVNNNRIPGRAYFDLAATQKVRMSGTEFELFGAINNLLDRDPPAMPSGNLGTNQVLFDPVGRAFRLGVRVKLGS